MAKEDLTGRDLEQSRAFVSALEDAGFPIGFAGWLRDSEKEGEPWRFYLATPLWDLDGPINTVSLIDRFVSARGAAFGLDMHDIEIGPSEASQMRAIRQCVHLEGSSAAVNNSKFNGVPVESPAVYVSRSPAGREQIKAARRRFEQSLAEIEAA